MNPEHSLYCVPKWITIENSLFHVSSQMEFNSSKQLKCARNVFHIQYSHAWDKLKFIHKMAELWFLDIYAFGFVLHDTLYIIYKKQRIAKMGPKNKTQKCFSTKTSIDFPSNCFTEMTVIKITWWTKQKKKNEIEYKRFSITKKEIIQNKMKVQSTYETFFFSLCL